MTPPHDPQALAGPRLDPLIRSSHREAVVIRRLHAGLAEAEAALINNHDTVDACAATGGRATEFVSP